jgi:tripartite-type tricarboxylate transporter receptor subunit TctC
MEKGKISEGKFFVLKHFWAILVAGIILCAGVSPLQAQEKEYPNRQIEFIIPYDPGGSVDIWSRVFAEAVKDILKVPVVSINKPGAGGAVGSAYVASAKPDGYTLGAGSYGAMVISPIVEPKLPYKRSDLTLICQTLTFPVGLFVKADAPWKNLKELIEYAKANPNKLRATVGGASGIPSLVLESFKIQAGGLQIISIPTKGGGSMATAILGGHAELCSDPVGSEAGLLKAGRVRALAVSGKVPEFPELPTFAEAGVPGVNLDPWMCVIAPKGLPKTILDKVTAAYEKAAKSPAVIDQLYKQAMNVDFIGPEAFAKKIEQDDLTIREIVKKVGMVK